MPTQEEQQKVNKCVKQPFKIIEIDNTYHSKDHNWNKKLQSQLNIFLQLYIIRCILLKGKNHEKRQKEEFSQSTTFLPSLIIQNILKTFLNPIHPLSSLNLPLNTSSKIKKINQVKLISEQASVLKLKNTPCNYYHSLQHRDLMKNQNTKEVMDVLYVNEPTSRNFTQHFEYANQFITHQHRVEVSHVEQDDHLEVKNHFTVQSETKLEKVTEIMFQNRIIKIIDTFESIDNPNLNYRRQEVSNEKTPTLKKVQNPKKYTIFKTNQEELDAHKIKDTKNAVKNIVRLFQCWLEESLPKYKEVYDLLLAIVGKIKFNNHLIMKLMKEDSIRKAFVHFGHKDGKEFIDKSKIHDKKTHMEALERYIQLFQSEAHCDRLGEQVNATTSVPVMLKQS